jgi:formylglycine-generating enzyme required for sulfatase activity
MIVALMLLLAACGHRESRSTNASSPSFDVASLQLKFVPIAPGHFTMGSEMRKGFDEGPVHEVRLTKRFELQTTEVTQAQWKGVMGTNPSHFRGDRKPVDNVSWDDVQVFLEKLNEADPDHHYRLPTEAEWEYAARAGTTEPRYGDVDAIAWFHRNSGDESHPVGEKQPNAWGLYDMLGNVWELVADWKDSYPSTPVTDPTGPPTGYYKVSRGGGWYDTPPAVTATFRASPERSARSNSIGFRLARDAQH